jgi:hypothetical protein
MTFNPKVSIIIPVYNGSNYLREAIDSALAQTYANIEILVVNDGSNDGGKTEEIAKSYRDGIRYFCKENGGVSSALNLGINASEGEYISWLSHDDLYLPEKIMRQVRHLEGSGDKRIILYSDYKDLNMRSGRMVNREIGTFDSKDPVFNTICCLFGSVIHGCTLLIPKILFTEAGFFDEKLKTTQDYDLWFRFVKAGVKFVRIPEPLIVARRHEAQHTNLISDVCRKEVDNLHSWACAYLNDILKTFSKDQLDTLRALLKGAKLYKTADLLTEFTGSDGNYSFSTFSWLRAWLKSKNSCC